LEDKTTTKNEHHKSGCFKCDPAILAPPPPQTKRKAHSRRSWVSSHVESGCLCHSPTPIQSFRGRMVEKARIGRYFEQAADGYRRKKAIATTKVNQGGDSPGGTMGGWPGFVRTDPGQEKKQVRLFWVGKRGGVWVVKEDVFFARRGSLEARRYPKSHKMQIVGGPHEREKRRADRGPLVPSIQDEKTKKEYRKNRIAQTTRPRRNIQKTGIFPASRQKQNHNQNPITEE